MPRSEPISLGFSPADQSFVGLTEDDDCNVTLNLSNDVGHKTSVVFIDAWGYRWQRELQVIAKGEDDSGTYEVHGSEWIATLDAVADGAVVGGGPLRHFRIQLNAAGTLEVVCAGVEVRPHITSDQ
jgi:hypothetical protein